MGADATVTLRFAEQTLADVKWTWGTLYPAERRWQDGWGTAIEVPAVLEILDLISADKITSAQVRGLLTDVAEQVIARNDRDYGDATAEAVARCHGDCRRCQDREPSVRRDYEYLAEQRRKARDPEYAYVVRGRLAHSISCRHVCDLRRDSAFAPGAGFRDLLHEVVHYGVAIDTASEPLTWEGLVRWCEANTGPQGGCYYRACKTCHVHLPLP